MRAKTITGAVLIAAAVLLAGVTVYMTLGLDLLRTLWLYAPSWVLLICGVFTIVSARPTPTNADRSP
jgi:hypothetical protein